MFNRKNADINYERNVHHRRRKGRRTIETEEYKQTQRQPLVSVIIPTYNREKILPRALNSVIEQTYNNWEIIVVDDRSTDNTKKVVQEYIKNDKRIKYVTNTYKQGSGGARNKGIENSKGEYIAFLDSDDFWEKDKLEIQLKEMIKAQNSFSCTSVKYINYPYSLRSKGKQESGNVFDRLLLTNFMMISAVIIKREVLDKVGFFDESMFTSQDWDLWLRTAKIFELLFINIPLGTYVRENEFIDDTTLELKGELPDRGRDLARIYKKIKKIYKLNREQTTIIRRHTASYYFNKGYGVRKNKKIKALVCYLVAMFYYYDPIYLKAIKKLFIIGYYKNNIR